MSITLIRLSAIVLASCAVAAVAFGEDAVLSPRQVLLHSEAAVTSGPRVVRGLVTFVSGIVSNRFVIAPQEQPWMQGLSVEAPSHGEMPQPGDLVLVSGDVVSREGEVTLCARDIEFVRHEFLFEPKRVKQADYRRGILVGRRVLLEGEVREVRPWRGGARPVTELMVFIDNYSTVLRVPGRLEAEAWLGEPVRAAGLVRSQYGEGGAFLDSWLEVADDGDIRRLRGENLSRVLIVGAAFGGAVLLLSAGVFLFLWVRARRERREMEVVAAERRRMAADLHDTIEQHLAGANLIAAGVTALEDVPPDVKEAMKTLTALLANAKSEVRSAVLSLRSAGDSCRTLARMIEDMVVSLEKTGIRSRRCLRGLPESLPEGVSRDIELIVREATTNAIKHGKARNIVFTADPRGAGGFVLRVLNDGEPFEVERALGPETGHYGLSGMRERALRNRLAISWGRDRGWMYMELISEGI